MLRLSEHEGLRAAQGHQCSVCHEPFDGRWLRKVTLRELIDGNLTAMCTRCHAFFRARRMMAVAGLSAAELEIWFERLRPLDEKELKRRKLSANPGVPLANYWKPTRESWKKKV